MDGILEINLYPTERGGLAYCYERCPIEGNITITEPLIINVQSSVVEAVEWVMR